MESQTSTPLGEMVRRAEQEWTLGNIHVSKYVDENFYEDINKIEAYLNSKHTSGEVDNLGREKPFFNICIAARNIWFRATDVDRKNIRAKAKKAKDLLASYIYTIHLQKWMKDDNFGKFLNDWGLYLASFNSAVCKFVEKKDGLHASVMDWNKMIVDIIDFDSNPKIEILELTPAQLRSKTEYDQELVEKLISAQTTRKNPDRQSKDQKAQYIRLYEVHGKMPLSYLTGEEEDEKEYVQQMQVISFVESKGDGKFDDYTLYSGREKQDPYLLTYLIPNVDGSISLNGSVKQLFEAQWMVNHSKKAIKDQLDLASKLIFQTSDPTFANANALTSIENGQILVWNAQNPNGQLTQLANNSHDITSLQNFGTEWKNLAQEITSTPDVMGGETFPSGTAYRQAVIVQQEAYSNFKIMIQNKGLFIEEMMRRWITPYILKQMDTNEEIVATLDAYGIDKIDQRYIQAVSAERFNKKLVDAVIARGEARANGQDDGSIPLPNLEEEQMMAQKELQEMGDQRFIKPSEIESKTWKEALKEFEADVEYEITNENVDKQATFDTLNSVFQTLAGMQGRPMTPEMKIVWNKILGEAGKISPVELNSVQTMQPMMQPAMPMSGPQVGAGMNNQPIQ